MLEGEYEWLSAVVSNLADDNTKLVYADWLQEHGDEDRAEFLRKFVAAAETMNEFDFPLPKFKHTEEWFELIGYQLLFELARIGVWDMNEQFTRLARPALRMRKKKSNPSAF